MKLDEFEFKGQDNELIDFKDQVTTLINFGKYAYPVLYQANSTPTWNGREGEQVYAYVVGGASYLAYQYVYLNSGWRYVTWSADT